MTKKQIKWVQKPTDKFPCFRCQTKEAIYQVTLPIRGIENAFVNTCLCEDCSNEDQTMLTKELLNIKAEEFPYPSETRSKNINRRLSLFAGQI